MGATDRFSHCPRWSLGRKSHPALARRRCRWVKEIEHHARSRLPPGCCWGASTHNGPGLQTRTESPSAHVAAQLHPTLMRGVSMVLTYHARVFIISCLVLLALLPSADAQNLDTSSSTRHERAFEADSDLREDGGQACEVMGPCGRCDCRLPIAPLLL